VCEALPGRVWTDLVSGAGLVPCDVGGGRVAVDGDLPAGGIAAVLASAGRPAVAVGGRVGRPLAPLSGDGTFPARAAVRVPVLPMPRAAGPAGMVAVEGGRRELRVEYRLRETGL